MNTTIRTKLYAALCCAFGTGALCTHSSSAEAEDAPSRVVRFADLDITKPAGAKVLYGRIRVAAHTVCEQSAGGDPILRPAVHACIDKAIDEAVRKVDAPALTALRFGGSGDVRLASK
jgi:UrcA family protein